MLVRRGKGDKPRRQPLSVHLAIELGRWRARRDAAPSDPVFCGLAGARLQPTILAGIIRRAAQRAGLSKHVTAHTLPTPPRRGRARRRATRAWWPSTSATPTSRPSPVTRMWRARSSTQPRRLSRTPRATLPRPHRLRADQPRRTARTSPSRAARGLGLCHQPSSAPARNRRAARIAGGEFLRAPVGSGSMEIAPEFDTNA
jgi:hypothetical protein